MVSVSWGFFPFLDQSFWIRLNRGGSASHLPPCPRPASHSTPRENDQQLSRVKTPRIRGVTTHDPSRRPGLNLCGPVFLACHRKPWDPRAGQTPPDPCRRPSPKPRLNVQSSIGVPVTTDTKLNSDADLGAA